MKDIARLDKTYLVRIKAPSFALQRVTADLAEIHGDHLVFLNSSMPGPAASATAPSGIRRR